MRKRMVCMMGTDWDNGRKNEGSRKRRRVKGIGRRKAKKEVIVSQ